MRIDKDNIKIILILLVVCLGIGYSYLNTELNINGTANINSANWSVYWNNVQVESGSVTAPTPTIDSDKTTVSYTVTLEKPGDFYEFTVDAVNAGTIDAMIETIDSKLNGVTMEEVPAYLDYGISYSDDTPLEENQELLHDSTETYKVHIGYSENIEATDLPSTNQSLSLQFAITYKQANESSEAVGHIKTVYTISSIWSHLGQSIPNDITQYNNASDALVAIGILGDDYIPFYLRHTLQGRTITESYVEFIVTPEMVLDNPGMIEGTYALRGGIDESQLAEKPVYEQNKAKMLSAFEISRCHSNASASVCELPSGYDVECYTNGDVRAGYSTCECFTSEDGSSICHC